MFKMGRLFHRSCKYEIYCLYISYIINLMIINVFVMLATGVGEIQNESLSQNDASQLTTIISSVVLVSALTIIFFQWVINMQIRVLYNRRNQFNVNIRLIGIDKNMLTKLYIRELLVMQLYVIPIGIISSQLVFKILALIINLKEKAIPVNKLFIGVIIHLVVIIVSEIMIIQKLTQKGVAEQLRTTSSMENIPSKSKLLIYFIIGTILVVISNVFENMADIRQIAWLSKLIIFLSFFFFYDPVMYMFNKIICFISEKFRIYQILLAQKICYGYFYRVKIVCLMIIFSTTIFLGLQMLYMTVREAGYDVVENNIKYDGIVSWDEMQNQKHIKGDNFQGIRIKTKTSTGTNIYISGINKQFAEEYENINLAKVNHNSLLEFLGNSNNNGILLPEFYITDEDIGKDMSVEIENKIITFKILGGYYSNDFSKLICFVNNDYIKNKFNLKDEYNIAYLKNSIEDLEYLDVESSYYQSKENIAKESVDKAVGGTDIIEMITIIIIICAIISLINFFVMTASTNNKDIIRFRALGINSKNLLGIYIIHAILPILFSTLWIIPFSALFNRIACNIMLASEYFSGGYAKVPNLTAIVIILVTAISIVSEVICVWKAIYSEADMGVLKTDN